MAFPSIAYKSDRARQCAGTRTSRLIRASHHDLQQSHRLWRGLHPDILAQLADTPEIVCIKEESGDIRRVTDIYNACGDRFAVFCGVDDLILESAALGVTGWVSGMPMLGRKNASACSISAVPGASRRRAPSIAF